VNPESDPDTYIPENIKKLAAAIVKRPEPLIDECRALFGDREVDANLDFWRGASQKNPQMLKDVLATTRRALACGVVKREAGAAFARSLWREWTARAGASTTESPNPAAQ
jgi:hypothetical protein